MNQNTANLILSNHNFIKSRKKNLIIKEFLSIKFQKGPKRDQFWSISKYQ